MKKFIITVFLLIFLSGCMNDSQAETLFSYEGTLSGNNSDVTAILKSIEHGEYVEKVELHTKDKPYGLTIHYEDNPDGETDAWTRRNAVKLLTLIDNAETVNILIESEIYSYSKQSLESKYGKNFDKIASEKEWKEMNTWTN